MFDSLEGQLEPVLDSFSGIEDSLLLAWPGSSELSLPGQSVTLSPDAVELREFRDHFDLIVVILGQELDPLVEIELPILAAAALKPGAGLLLSSPRKAMIEFPLIKVKFTIPPDGSDLTLTACRKAP